MYKILAVAALGGLLFGFDTGIISGAIFFIQKTLFLDTFMTQVVVSAVLLGALVGSFCSASLTNRWGRLAVLEMDAILFLLATLLSAFAPSVGVLILARFGVGIAVGISCYLVPLYISELSPARFRGSFVALNTIAVTGGILISYLTCFALSPYESWRWMLGMGILPAVILLTAVRFLPESPRWLVQQGKIEEARKVLLQVRSASEAEKEFKQISEKLKESKPKSADLFRPEMKKRLWLGIVLAIVQQVTGINGILYYTPILLQKVGFEDVSQVMLWTLCIGLLNFLMTFVILLKVDRRGRRVMLLTGLIGMTFTLSLLALGLTFDFDSLWTRGIILANLFGFIIFYAGSIGCIFWIVIAEIYPLPIRGLAMGIASGFNWASNLFVSFTFLSLLEMFGASFVFSLYAFACFLSFLFCYRYLPETAQYSLEEMDSISF